MGVSGTNHNFGELLPASLAGNVFLDKNNDGVRQPTEKLLAGVRITLTGVDDLGNAILLKQFTDGQGHYAFTGLRPGSYTIKEKQPPNYADGKTILGSLGGVVTPNKFSAITLGMGLDGVEYNFAERKLQYAGKSAFIGIK